MLLKFLLCELARASKKIAVLGMLAKARKDHSSPLVEMCLITKMMGVVCEVVAGFLQVPEVQYPHGLITE